MMLRRLKKQAKKSFPIYSFYLQAVNTRRYIQWELQGRHLPPPHIIKQRCVLNYQKLFCLNTLVETGTYQGSMILATRRHFSNIYSIELDENLFQNAQTIFARFTQIHIIFGDSSSQLAKLLVDIDNPCLFWLDAHYSGDGTAKGIIETPIASELDTILNHPVKDHVVLIDDARCFDGTSDYPTLVELEKYVLDKLPSWTFKVKDDIIRIHKQNE